PAFPPRQPDPFPPPAPPPPLPPAEPPPPPRDDLKFAAKIEGFAAAAVDPASGSALATQARGRLKHYPYPPLQPQGPDKLDGAATRAALDGRRGLLYAAVTPAGPRGFGDRPAPGDIKVYDVEKVLHGKGQPGSELRSVGVVPANAVVSHLFLSPDGKWL